VEWVEMVSRGSAFSSWSYRVSIDNGAVGLTRLSVYQ